MNQDKRRHRELKREIKKAGTRKMRRRLKRALADDPTATTDTDFNYGRNSSAALNGNDHDATRRRGEE
jgi:hypothetical protein